MTASYDDFKKIDLRIGRVLEAARIEGSDKLIALTVNLGCTQQPHADACPPEHADHRHIVAGIGAAYEPDDLVGKDIAVVSNLAPRMLMGHESSGMILAARGIEGKPVLLVPASIVSPGSSIS